MNFENRFMRDFPIPKHKDIYILGSGISLDLFDRTLLDRDKHTIITCNGTISYPNCPPHFQVACDEQALVHWSKHKNATKDVLWISKENKSDIMKSLKLNYTTTNRIVKDLPKHTGTGAEALHLAIFISTYIKIDKVYYIGFDFTKLQYNFTHYWYANTSECMPFQKHKQAPFEWFKHRHATVPLSSYNKQLNVIATNITTHKEFCKKLVCLSNIDITRLNYRFPDCNYSKAITKII